MLAASVPLVALFAACDRHPHEPNGHDDLHRVEIIDRGQTESPVVATWTAATGWQGTLPSISLSTPTQRASLGARIYDDDNQQLTLTEGGENSIRWALAPNAPAGVIVTDDSRGQRFHGDHVHIYGQAAGTTRIQFLLWHFDHADGATDPIEIRVVD